MFKRINNNVTARASFAELRNPSIADRLVVSAIDRCCQVVLLASYIIITITKSSFLLTSGVIVFCCAYSVKFSSG